MSQEAQQSLHLFIIQYDTSLNNFRVNVPGFDIYWQRNTEMAFSLPHYTLAVFHYTENMPHITVKWPCPYWLLMSLLMVCENCLHIAGQPLWA